MAYAPVGIKDNDDDDGMISLVESGFDPRVSISPSYHWVTEVANRKRERKGVGGGGGESKRERERRRRRERVAVGADSTAVHDSSF